MPSLSTWRRSVDMEAPRHSNFSTPFRKVEVLYLLSRGAQLEHPHMINVQYAAHQPGPTLTDVKDRLIALRGKDMPDSFSWSFKRKYKDTFIWCDLFDDDFILPLVDSGEYVLKAIELFDTSQDASDEEIEYHSARESLPIRNTPRLSSLSRFSRASTDSDVMFMARKESSFFFNEEAGDITSDISMDLSKQIIWNDSPYSKGAPEDPTIDHSNVSGSGTYPNSFEVVENKYIPERQGSRSVAARPDRIAAMKRCSSSPHGVYRESLLQRDGARVCKEFADAKLESAFSPSPTSLPRSVPARRRTWEKEVDKITIYTDLSFNQSSDDERTSPRLDVPIREVLREPGAPLSAVAEDSFFHLLRKATRLGSFRPRLCRGVDVVDSTRVKTPRMHFRSKAKDEVNKLLSKSPVKQGRSSTIKPSRNHNANSFAELGNNQIRLPEKTVLTKTKNKTFADKPVKEFKTLAEYIDSKERNPPDLKLVSAPHSVAGTPRHHSTIAEPESRPHGTAALAIKPQAANAPRPESCSSGNEALDVTHQKTMEVLAQLSTSQRAAKIGAVRTTQGAIESSGAGGRPVTQGEPSPEDSLENMISEQRRPVVKEQLGEPIASSVTTTGSYRVEAATKPTAEEGIETPRFSKRYSAEKVNIASLLQRPESGTLNSRTLHSGNKQGVKIGAQVLVQAEDAAVQSTPKLSSSEREKGWPFEQPLRSRDFNSREERLLIPGLTHMDWEKSFQEAAMYSEPPVDLVLHECSHCGRTFKLDSLQVHLRGCHAVKKPKSAFSQKKRLSL